MLTKNEKSKSNEQLLIQSNSLPNLVLRLGVFISNPTGNILHQKDIWNLDNAEFRLN